IQLVAGSREVPIANEVQDFNTFAQRDVGGIGDHGVVAAAVADDVASFHHVEGIVAFAAAQGVIARAAREGVVAGAAVQDVGSVCAGEVVVQRIAGQIDRNVVVFRDAARFHMGVQHKGAGRGEVGFGRVVATVFGLHDAVVGVIDAVDVIAGQTGHRIVAAVA